MSAPSPSSDLDSAIALALVTCVAVEVYAKQKNRHYCSLLVKKATLEGAGSVLSEARGNRRSGEALEDGTKFDNHENEDGKAIELSEENLLPMIQEIQRLLATDLSALTRKGVVVDAGSDDDLKLSDEVSRLANIHKAKLVSMIDEEATKIAEKAISTPPQDRAGVVPNTSGVEERNQPTETNVLMEADETLQLSDEVAKLADKYRARILAWKEAEEGKYDTKSHDNVAGSTDEGGVGSVSKEASDPNQVPGMVFTVAEQPTPSSDAGYETGIVEESTKTSEALAPIDAAGFPELSDETTRLADKYRARLNSWKVTAGKSNALSADADGNTKTSDDDLHVKIGTAKAYDFGKSPAGEEKIEEGAEAPGEPSDGEVKTRHFPNEAIESVQKTEVIAPTYVAETPELSEETARLASKYRARVRSWKPNGNSTTLAEEVDGNKKQNDKEADANEPSDVDVKAHYFSNEKSESVQKTEVIAPAHVTETPELSDETARLASKYRARIRSWKPNGSSTTLAAEVDGNKKEFDKQADATEPTKANQAITVPELSDEEARLVNKYKASFLGWHDEKSSKDQYGFPESHVEDKKPVDKGTTVSVAMYSATSTPASAMVDDIAESAEEVKAPETLGLSEETTKLANKHRAKLLAMSASMSKTKGTEVVVRESRDENDFAAGATKGKAVVVAAKKAVAVKEDEDEDSDDELRQLQEELKRLKKRNTMLRQSISKRSVKLNRK